MHWRARAEPIVQEGQGQEAAVGAGEAMRSMRLGEGGGGGGSRMSESLAGGFAAGAGGEGFAGARAAGGAHGGGAGHAPGVLGSVVGADLDVGGGAGGQAGRPSAGRSAKGWELGEGQGDQGGAAGGGVRGKGSFVVDAIDVALFSDEGRMLEVLQFRRPLGAERREGLAAAAEPAGELAGSAACC